METIGLIAAMRQESQALLRLVPETKRLRLGGFEAAEFSRADRYCLLVTSGMGFERAGQAAGELAARGAGLLISFGIAGAAEDELRIGDVVVAQKCFWQDLEGPSRPLATLSADAWDAAGRGLEGRLLTGTAITTRGAQLHFPASAVDHPILEMETFGAAGAAGQAGVPLLSIRSISDGPAEPIPLDLEAVLDEHYRYRLGGLLAQVLRHPGILLRSGALTRNSALAARQAARAVLAVLDQPGALTGSAGG